MFEYFYQSHHDNILWQVSLSQLIHQSIKLYHESIKQNLCMYHQIIHIHFSHFKRNTGGISLNTEKYKLYQNIMT